MEFTTIILKNDQWCFTSRFRENKSDGITKSFQITQRQPHSINSISLKSEAQGDKGLGRNVRNCILSCHKGKLKEGVAWMSSIPNLIDMGSYFLYFCDSCLLNQFKNKQADFKQSLKDNTEVFTKTWNI